MKRYRGKCQEEPKDLTSAGYLEGIPQAWCPNVQPSTRVVCLINLLTCWRKEALHAVIAGSEDCCAQDIDKEMQPLICPLGNVARTAFQCSYAVGDLVPGQRRQGEGGIDDECRKHQA